MNDIDKTLKERGNIYGSFEAQATCVGKIINACYDCAQANGKSLDDAQLGSIAYIAIKLSRFANGETTDTLLDMEGYSRLIKEMYRGKTPNNGGKE